MISDESRVARAVPVFLPSDEASRVTGVTFDVTEGAAR
jgi:hypothetical protein